MPDKSRAIASQNDGSPSDQEVRASLDALLNNKAFKASSRNRRFLAYVVGETLAGRGDRNRAYHIAVHALDRAEDFDPLTDPIVRIEASRLRRSLENYYLTAGQHDRIRIDMPKGAYTATFCYRDVPPLANQAASAADDIVESKTSEAPQHLGTELAIAVKRKRPGRAGVILPIAAILAAVSLVYLAYYIYGHRYAVTPHGSPSIRVDRIEADPRNAEQVALARKLTLELVGHLTARNRVRVYAPDLSNTLPSDSQGAAPDYVLAGFVRSDSSVMVQLMDWQSGRIIWVSNIDADMTAAGGFDFQVRASEAIANAIERHVKAR